MDASFVAGAKYSVTTVVFSYRNKHIPQCWGLNPGLSYYTTSLACFLVFILIQGLATWLSCLGWIQTCGHLTSAF